MWYAVSGCIGAAMSIEYRIITGGIAVLPNKLAKNAHFKNNSFICNSKLPSNASESINWRYVTFTPNTELKSSMIMWRSSMCRRVFFTPLAVYSGGRFVGGDGINLSNCKLSNRLWHTSFIFDMDNCINFNVWYSVQEQKEDYCDLELINNAKSIFRWLIVFAPLNNEFAKKQTFGYQVVKVQLLVVFHRFYWIVCRKTTKTLEYGKQNTNEYCHKWIEWPFSVNAPNQRQLTHSSWNGSQIIFDLLAVVLFTAVHEIGNKAFSCLGIKSHAYLSQINQI